MVIPARDAVASLPGALEAIRRQTYPGVVEVVIASADEATSEAGRTGDAVVVPNPSGETAAGLNLAIAASSGDVVVRCDVGARLPPDYIERAVATLERTGADNVGGMQVPVGTTLWERAIAAAMSSRWGAGDARYRVGGEEGPAETVYLGVFPRTTLQRLDGYDEEFIRTQDYELNHRILASGGSVWFDPELKVEYRPRGSLPTLARQYFEYGQAKRRFQRKHPGGLRLRQLAPPILVLGLAFTAIASFWWPPALLFWLFYVLDLIIVSVPGPAPAIRTAFALATMHLAWGLGFLTSWTDGT